MTRLSRRAVMAGAVAGGGCALAPAVLAAPATAERFDAEADVVVCGAGAAGLVTALFARWQGAEVIVLEKGASIGGTAAKAAFWYWVPNNPALQALGIKDEKADFIRLIARLTTPDNYDPDDAHFGMCAWRYALTEAFYDSGSPAVSLLHEKGALPYQHVPDAPDYWAELSENKVKRGRALVPQGINAALSDGGRVAMRNLFGAARREGVSIKTSHRVDRTLQDADGRVSGVEVVTSEGDRIRIRARKGVVFASGGFTHNDDMRQQYLGYPALGGCATLTNEGDIISATSRVGVQLANMNNAWMAPIPLERAVRREGGLMSVFAMSGDSMIIVNKNGDRVADEKQPYNELAKVFATWDGRASEHPNLVMISVWDQRAQEKFASPYFGSLIVPQGSDDSHVIKGRTLDELTRNITARLDGLRQMVSTRLAPDFTEKLAATITRFNAMAAKGKDEDFSRGERLFSLFLNGPAREPQQRNPTMWPLAKDGPFFASLLAPGLLDTKGGPKTDADARVLDTSDRPIPGLYGVGNCVAAASGAAYCAGGATLGPILAFAYRAANAVVADASVRQA